MPDVYRSPYEAYPFLCDKSDDLRCDFELLTDEIASMTGMLAHLVQHKTQQSELLRVCELVYHLNPTLRTHFSVTAAEQEWLLTATNRLHAETAHRCDLFVLPQGKQAGGTAHLLRVKAKCLVRLLYRHAEQGHAVPNEVFDFANLLSGYYFHLALQLNEQDQLNETPYRSRNYK